MTWEVLVRVRFVQSGGIIGAVHECELDSTVLPEADARELEALVSESGLEASGDFRSAEARDLRLYEIEVVKGGARVAVTFDDHTLPESARPLVSFLRRNAQRRGRR